MRGTTIECQNAFVASLCFAYVLRDRSDSQNTREQVTSDRRSKRA